jgi:predicted aspartyl protease
MIVDSFPYSTSYSPSAPVVQIVVTHRGSATLSALVDSGADATLIPVDILHAIKAPFIQTHTMIGVNNTRHIVDLYRLRIQVGVGPTLYGVRAVATSQGGEAILGRDVLNHLIVTLNGVAGVTEISV